MDESMFWMGAILIEVLASVSLALLVLTIINAAVCWANFDKGLKPHCK